MTIVSAGIPNMPMMRFPPFFQGVAGVEHSSYPDGARVSSRGLVFYVDANTGDDANDGWLPSHPKLTIQSAVDSDYLVSGSVIQLAPGTYSESVETPDYVTGPNYVTIVGMGSVPYAVQWNSGLATNPCLDLQGLGWRIQNIKFFGPVTESAVHLRFGDSGANDIASHTVIQGCVFEGLDVGRYGITQHGAADVWILDCLFKGFHNAVGGGAIALWNEDHDVANPYNQQLQGCTFRDNDNHVICPMDGSTVSGNSFQSIGLTYTAVQTLETSIAANVTDANVVSGNIFGGDYSLAGGYRGGAADSWIGNISDDLLEAEVADNGFTVAPPA